MPKMPCHITDGPDYDDWLESDREPEDEDAAYERYRQQKIDDGECMTAGCGRPHEPNDTHCSRCNAISNGDKHDQL